MKEAQNWTYFTKLNSKKAIFLGGKIMLFYVPLIPTISVLDIETREKSLPILTDQPLLESHVW